MSLFHPTDARWLRARTTAPSSFGISPRSKRPPHSTDIERRFQPSPFRPTANIWPAAAGRCASGTRQHSKKLPRQARQSGRGDELPFKPDGGRIKPLITPGTACSRELAWKAALTNHTNKQKKTTKTQAQT